MHNKWVNTAAFPKLLNNEEGCTSEGSYKVLGWLSEYHQCDTHKKDVTHGVWAVPQKGGSCYAQANVLRALPITSVESGRLCTCMCAGTEIWTVCHTQHLTRSSRRTPEVSRSLHVIIWRSMNFNCAVGQLCRHGLLGSSVNPSRSAQCGFSFYLTQGLK